MLTGISNWYNKQNVAARLIVLLASCAVVLGFVCPSLISSNSTVAVLLGIVIGVGYIYVAWQVAIQPLIANLSQ